MKGQHSNMNCHGSSVLIIGDKNPVAWQLSHAVPLRSTATEMASSPGTQRFRSQLHHSNGQLSTDVANAQVSTLNSPAAREACCVYWQKQLKGPSASSVSCSAALRGTCGRACIWPRSTKAFRNT